MSKHDWGDQTSQADNVQQEQVKSTVPIFVRQSKEIAFGRVPGVINNGVDPAIPLLGLVNEPLNGD